MSKIKEIEEVITPVIEGEKMELVDLQLTGEHGKRVLRVFLDQPGGIRLSDCEKMSDKIGAVLDEKDVLAGAYVLEISSPGLDRVLKNEKDFARFKGQKARITVYAPIEGQRHFLGEIIATEKDAVTIQDVSMEKTVRIEMDKIAQARLEPDIDIE